MRSINRNGLPIGYYLDNGSSIHYYDLNQNLVAIYYKQANQTRPMSGGIDVGDTGARYV